MMTYREKEEIRNEISLIRELMNIQVEGYNPSHQQRLKSVESFKKNIRKKLAQYNNRTEERHYTDDDSYYYKEWFSEPFTEEEKREYIEDNWQSVGYYPYSPTGLWFTTKIVVCNVETSFGAKAVAYHFMSFDC